MCWRFKVHYSSVIADVASTLDLKQRWGVGYIGLVCSLVFNFALLFLEPEKTLYKFYHLCSSTPQDLWTKKLSLLVLVSTTKAWKYFIYIFCVLELC